MRSVLRMLSAAALPFAAGPAMTPVSPAPNLDGSGWILATLAERTPSGHDRVTLEFNAGRVQGTDGCNRYSGPYSATGAQLKIGPDVASTQMACPEQVMHVAASFMDALMLARSNRIQGAELQLLDAAGAQVAAFSALSHSLTGVARDRHE